jgi:hypothetical protein
MAEESGKRRIRFDLTNGDHVNIQMSDEELKAAMNAIDNDGFIGTFNIDVPQQLWILGRHVVSVTYEVQDGSSEWGNP